MERTGYPVGGVLTFVRPGRLDFSSIGLAGGSDPPIEGVLNAAVYSFMLLGRRTYEATCQQGGGMPGMQVHVFSRTLRQSAPRQASASRSLPCPMPAHGRNRSAAPICEWCYCRRADSAAASSLSPAFRLSE